jgi:hypothetical protein
MGIRSNVNNTRDWLIFADFAHLLIERAKRLYIDQPNKLDLAATVYALDSTTIDLCLTLFPWATFRSTKSAIKVHTLMNLQGSIPEFILALWRNANHHIHIVPPQYPAFPMLGQLVKKLPDIRANFTVKHLSPTFWNEHNVVLALPFCMV